MTLRILLWTVCLFLPSPMLSQEFPVLTSHTFFDNFGDDQPARMIKTGDGNLLIGGHTVTNDSLETGCGNIWIMKVDTFGSLLWEREINMSGCEQLRDLMETEDNGIIFSGITTSLIPNPERGDAQYWSNLMIGKIDSIGKIEWLQSYGGSDQDQGYQLCQGPNQEYLVCGFTHSTNGDIPRNRGLADVWALSIDNQGGVKKSLTFGGTGNDWALSSTRCANGDVLLAGYTDSQDIFRNRVSPFGNGLIIRVTPAGVARWIKPYACPQGGEFSVIKELENERIMVAGYCRSKDRSQRFWWMLLSPEGLVIHETQVEGPESGYVTSAIPCRNGFLLGGYSTGQQSENNSYRKGGEDFWLVKLDDRGNVLWKDTYGGPSDERCIDVLEYSPGVYYAIGQKKNQFTRENNQNLDYWLIKVEERSAETIDGSIWVRMEDNKIYHQKPTRFSAKVNHGDRFLWDFGDGTTSTDPHPLKSYDIPGLYDVSLTIFVNERCQKTLTMPQPLEVW